MESYRCIQLFGVDCGSVAIETPLEFTFSFTSVLNTINVGKYEISDGAGDMTS